MRAAVVIGVDAVQEGLPRLQAAASGAEEVAEWLRRSDYDVKLFTDRKAPVERSAIFRAVNAIVQAGTAERLLVYFAGHGFLNGPVDEYWLLSGAPVDASEAINVSLSATMARYRGIPEIVFISDACRVAPASVIHSGIMGVSIVPNIRPSQRTADIDFYYATRPGDPAHERTSGEAERAHGLFTRVLMDSHKDAPGEALLAIGNRSYVRNAWLKRVLDERVNASAEAISLRLTQLPDVQLQILDGYIALNETSAAEGGSPPSQPGVEDGRAAVDREDLSRATPRSRGTGQQQINRPDGAVRRGSTRKGSLSRQPTVPPSSYEATPAIIGPGARETKEFRERARVLLLGERNAAFRPSGPGRGATLFCVGDTLGSVACGPQMTAGSVPVQADAPLLFNLNGPGSQVAVRFADGTGMLLPVLNDFACHIVRREGRTLSVSYTWRPWPEPRLDELRAEVMSAATLGLLDRSRESARELAQRVRQLKRFDPTLGLVAALAYVLAGDLPGAASVRRYMREDLQIDLFDSWLLGGGGEGPPVFPSVPLLAQTWSLFELFDAAIPEGLKQLRRVPGFWTVFDAKSMDRVMHIAHDDQGRIVDG